MFIQKFYYKSLEKRCQPLIIQKPLDISGDLPKIAFRPSEFPMDLPEKKRQKSPLFDFIVLLGMVANMILALFLILYYFDLI
jgi:hypothetical protein